MQHNKSTKNIEQIEKISQNDKQITQSTSEVINKFQVKSVFKEIDLVKRCGVLVSTISIALLILPFAGVASVAALLKSGLETLKQQKEQEQHLANELFDLKTNYRYCGLKKYERQNQYKKKRDRSSQGHKRIKEAESNKTDNMINLLKRVIKNGFVPDL